MSSSRHTPQGDSEFVSRLSCQLCRNGLLHFMLKMDTDDVYFECEECMMGYMSVSGEVVSDSFWADQAEWECRSATRAEIAAAGLEWAVRL